MRPRYAVEAWEEPVDLLARGQRAFAGHRFYEAQILWEAESLAATGERRGWIQGFAAIAGGMVALGERRQRSAARLLARGCWLLASAPSEVGDLDVAPIRATAEDVMEALRRGGDPALH